MKIKFNNFILLCLLLLAVVFVSGCIPNENKTNNLGYAITDAKGNIIHFDKKPQKVLTYAFALDGIVLGLVPTDRLVAINYLADDPNSSNIINLAAKIQHKTNRPSAEEILSLKPDVVFIFANDKADIRETLQDLGIKTVVCKRPTSIDEVKETIVLVAAALGENANGDKLIKKMDAQLLKIINAVAAIPKDRHKTVVAISMQPTFGGRGSAFDDICTHAGVINGMSKAGIKDGQVLGKERLVEINPDLLILPVFNNHGIVNIDKFNNDFKDDPALQTLEAIKNNAFYYPHEGYIYNLSQDIVFGVQDVAHGAYSDLVPLPVHEHLSVVIQN
jgi:iron complex transport system substrate-binding protein